MSRPCKVWDKLNAPSSLPYSLAAGFAVLCLTAACNLPLRLLPTVMPSPVPAASPEPQWQTIEVGLQWRKLIPNGDDLAQLIVVRIDPSRYRFRAIYQPGGAESLSNWRAREADASVIINANFFDSNDIALGLVVSDGAAHGIAYQDRGGAFLVRSGAPEIVSYRSLSFSEGGNIEQAVQGFPLLVEDGRQAYYAAGSGERTRRTVIGIDRSGNVLIMVAPFLGLSLADLSAYLSKTDLDIDAAFNLDGGGSTMIALAGADYFQPSLEPVPAVLAVYRRASG
ncbi:MAG: phosphodiester glycosidase family protein [Chloroflexi bacterium]|nr:phosphodiester glycosidase family protein [Chloroflexota bacterium]